jgi:hypothetical protein
MTLWGKDPGNDLGIRLNGLVGFLSCTMAGITFLLFREKAIQTEIEELEKGIEKGPDLEGSPS